jgi:hypothetical protein
MNKTEFLKMALEKLTAASNYIDTLGGVSKGYRMDIERIKAVLEAKDELVQWKMGASGIGGTGVIVQPQRTWVGLTDEDEIDWEEGGNLKDLVKAIEAKLKEKNT